MKQIIKDEKTLAFILLFLLLYVFTLLSFYSENAYGGSDNYVHYRIAKYAGDYPKLFLDLWGKPLFNLFAFPFAQLGFNGIKLFNIACGITCAFFGYLIARKLDYKHPLLAIVFILFTPVYFSLLPSSLTEVLFSALLLFGIYCFLNEKYILATIVFSFLPFARNEGFILFPLFALALAAKKRYGQILLLGTGYLTFSIIGLFVFKDILWIIHQHPYPIHNFSMYGQGSLWHFVNEYEHITGGILGLLFFAGVIALIVETIRSGKKTIPQWILLVLPFGLFFVFHSVLWWKGMGGSLGLLRVLGSVTPLLALVSVKGADWILNFLKNSYLKLMAGSLLVFFIVKAAFVTYRLPLHFDEQPKLIIRASSWIKDNNYLTKKIYYYDPLVSFFLEIDPYDKLKSQELIPDSEHPENDIAVGELVIWDAHFSPNEGHLPLEKMLNNKFFKVLKIIRPPNPIRVLGGYDYEIFIFQRVGYSFGGIEKQTIADMNFDNMSDQKGDSAWITNKYKLSGENSFLMNAERIYSPEVRIPLQDLPSENALNLEASVFFFPTQAVDTNGLVLVLAFENNGKLTGYSTENVSKDSLKINQWNKIELSSTIHTSSDKKELAKLYVWNNSGKIIYIDDFKVWINVVK